MSIFAIRAGTAIAAAALVGAILTTVPLQASYADQPAAPSAAADPATRALARVDPRNDAPHARLRTSAAQETLSGVVAQTMRDNATALRAGVADRLAHRETMTAVDDLNFFQIVADQHSAGPKTFIPTFAALYDAMTPAQKIEADRAFKDHRRMAGY